MALALALTLTFPLSVAYMGPLDWGEVIGGYLGRSLLGMSFTAIGVLSSSLTQNQIIAFILGFVLCFILYIVGHAAIYLPTPLSRALFPQHSGADEECLQWGDQRARPRLLSQCMHVSARLGE